MADGYCDHSLDAFASINDDGTVSVEVGCDGCDTQWSGVVDISSGPIDEEE